jgi:hypothetical protein
MTRLIYQQQKETQRGYAVENSIRLLSAEIYRLIRMPYANAKNKAQILYLEELLAAYERDLKKHD